MEFNKVISLRKSIRVYDKEKQISEEDLKKILFAGMAAPVSRKDYDSIKFIVLQDKKLLNEMAYLEGEKQNLLYGVPTLIIICSRPAKVKNIEYFNVACVVENMLLGAANLGLGSIYLTSFLNKLIERSDLIERLELPDGYLPLSAVGVGYIDKKVSLNTTKDIMDRIEVIRK